MSNSVEKFIKHVWGDDYNEEKVEREKLTREYMWFRNGASCPKCHGVKSSLQPKPEKCHTCGLVRTPNYVTRTCSDCGHSVAGNLPVVEVEYV